MVISFPCSPRLMVRFWQNTHRRLQPEKNTAPLPRVPEMHGSSPKCGAARATTGASGTAQKPNCPPARSTPQPRGQMEQSCVIMPPAHGVLREIYGFCGYYKVFFIHFATIFGMFHEKFRNPVRSCGSFI